MSGKIFSAILIAVLASFGSLIGYHVRQRSLGLALGLDHWHS